MALCSLEDPWDWSVDRVVQEICTDKRSWIPMSRNMSIGDPVLVEQIIRDQEINGAMLLLDVEHKVLEDFGIRSFGRRRFMINARDELRKLSTEYQKQAQNNEPDPRPLISEFARLTEFSSNIISLANILKDSANDSSDKQVQQRLPEQLRDYRLLNVSGTVTTSDQLVSAQENSVAANPDSNLQQLLARISGVELQELVAAAPASQLELLKTAIEAAQSVEPHASEMQISLASRPASSQNSSFEHPNGIGNSDRTSPDTTLALDEPSSKRQKLGQEQSIPTSSNLYDEGLSNGLSFIGADGDEDLLREIHDQMPDPGMGAESTPPSSSKKRKRPYSTEEQESITNASDITQQIPRPSISITPSGKKRATLTFIGPISARSIEKYEEEKALIAASHSRKDDNAASHPETGKKRATVVFVGSSTASSIERYEEEKAMLAASHGFKDAQFTMPSNIPKDNLIRSQVIESQSIGVEVHKSPTSSQPPDISKVHVEQSAAMFAKPKGLEGSKESSLDEQIGNSLLPTSEGQRSQLSIGPSQRTRNLTSANAVRSFYLAKSHFPVDEIFYGATAVGEDLAIPDTSDDFMLLPGDIPTSQRNYVHNCMKSFLMSKPQTLNTRQEGQDKRFTIVRPYRESLLDASGSVLQPEPSCTVYYSDDDGVVHAERALVADYPEFKRREYENQAKRRERRGKYGWPNLQPEGVSTSAFSNNPNAESEKTRLPFATNHRGLMHPRSSRAIKGDARFFAGLSVPQDHEDWLVALEKKYTAIPGGDNVLPFFGESDDENDFDEETWREICQEAGEKALHAIGNMKKTGKIQSLSPEEINGVIEEALAVFKSRWKLKHLPNLQRKAWFIWTKSRKLGSKNDMLLAAKEALDQKLERLKKWQDHFMSEKWSSKSQIRRVCGALEHTVFQVNEKRWTISLLEAKSAPPKPPKKLSVRKLKKQQQQIVPGDEDGELIGSDRSGDEESEGLEDDMSDFVVSDDEDLPDVGIAGETELSQQQSAVAMVENLQLEADADVEDEQDQDQQEELIVHPSPNASWNPGARVATPTRARKPSRAFPLNGSTETSDDPSSTPTTSLSTPIKRSLSTQLKLKTTSHENREAVDLTVTSPSVIDLVTPEKSEAEKKPRSALKIKLKVNNSRDTPLLDIVEKIPDPENRPPFNDLAAIDKYNYTAWAKLQDADRLLIKLFFNMNPSKRAEHFDYLSTLGFSADGQGKFWAKMKKVVVAINNGEDGADLDSHALDVQPRFIRLFGIFIECQDDGIYTPFWATLPDTEKTRMLLRVLDSERQYLTPFWKLCCKMEGYFANYVPASAPITPSRSPRKGKGKETLFSSDIEDEDSDESPRSSVKRRRDATLSNSDAFAEPSSPTKRKKRVHEDVFARDRREQDRERQAQQEQRRKELQARLVQSGRVEDLDLARIIINERADGVVQVSSNIAGRIKPHQMKGVRFMWDRIVTNGDESMEGCLLAHTMGLGKTLQTITLIVAIAEAASSIDTAISSQIPESLRVSKTLVLCPASLVDNWMDELLTWAPASLLGEFRKIDASLPNQHRLQTIEDWFEDGGVLLVGYDMFRNIIQNKARRGQEPPIDKFSHEQVLKHLLQGPNLVVADEAHILKNAAAGVTIAASKFRTKSRIALTGSPLANNVEEYYAMINFVAPGYLGSNREFRSKYAEPIEAGLSLDSTPNEFRRSLLKLRVLNEVLGTLVHRADMSVLKNDLPPKTEFVITVPLTELQRKAYTLYVRSMLEGTAYTTTKTGEVTQTTIWHWLTVLSLLCNHPACFSAKLLERRDAAQRSLSQQAEVLTPRSTADTDTTNEINLNAPVWKIGVSQELITKEMELFSQETSDLKSIDLSFKVQLMCQILDAAMDAGDKTLIFSQSIPTLDYIEELCYNQGRSCARLDGKTRVKNRQKLTKDFTINDTQICLISTGAGGLGLNLQSANRVIIFDFKFNPIEEEQAVGRAYRIGQKKPTYVYRFVAGGTYETAVHNKALFKMQLASRVVDKKNPVSLAKKRFGDYLFEPKNVPASDLSEFRGMDPFVLDKILATQGDPPMIRAIVQTDSFAQDNNDKLTEAEEKEAAQEGYEAKLKRSDPKAWDALQRKRTATTSATGNSRGGLNKPGRPSMPPANYAHNQSSQPPRIFSNPARNPGEVAKPRTPSSSSIPMKQGQPIATTSGLAILPPLKGFSDAEFPQQNPLGNAPRKSPPQNSLVRQDGQKTQHPPRAVMTSESHSNNKSAPQNSLVRQDGQKTQHPPRMAMTSDSHSNNKSPLTKARPNTIGAPSSPIMGSSTGNEADTFSSPPSVASVNQSSSVSEKKPMLSIQNLFRQTLQGSKGWGSEFKKLPFIKATELLDYIRANAPTITDRVALKRGAFEEIRKNAETCRQLVLSELTVEEFMWPLLSSYRQPTPNSSRAETTGQSAMYTAMARKPIRPPVQNLRTPVTRPPKRPTTSLENSPPNNDDEVIELVNRNRRLRGDFEIQRPSPTRTPQIPRWAEKEIDDTRRQRRQSSRASLNAASLPKKD